MNIHSQIGSEFYQIDLIQSACMEWFGNLSLLHLTKFKLA